jgi:hypothetical protein
VGALALPWVLLVIHLFFFEGENRLGDILNWVTAEGRQAAAGVLLFAITYTLDSAVSRIAQDCFNDDDLYLEIGGRLLRDGVTEDRILTKVYCESNKGNLLPAERENAVLADKVNTFQNFPDMKALCQQTLNVTVGRTINWQDNELNKTARDLFGRQEKAQMEKGGDFTVRLRQLHDQFMVLRGAAFNGVIGFSLCVFGFGAGLRRHKLGWLRLALVPVPVLYFAVALLATVHHYRKGVPANPPYMEFTLLLLAMVGAWLVWKHPLSKPGDRAQETVCGKETETQCFWQNAHWARLGVISALLTMAVFLGSWSTEVLYAQQVVYSYDSQGTTASQK